MKGPGRSSDISDHALAPIIPVPPDGEFGWVIIFICSLGNFSIDSLSISFPPIQKNLSDILHVSMPELALVMSVYNLMCYLTGPFSGAAANRIGFRLTMLIGALLGSIGLLTCFFIDSYAVYMTGMGVISGIGGSFVYMVSMAAPGFWFEDKRALAAGISTAASGLAAIVVPILSAQIEKLLGWRYVILIPTGGYCLLSVFSLLIRPAPAIYIGHANTKQTKQFRFDKAYEHSDVLTKSVVHLLGGVGVSHVKVKQVLDTGIDERQISDVQSAFPRTSYPSERKCRCCKKPPKIIERPMLKKDVFYQGSISRIRQKQHMTPGEYTLSVVRMPTYKDVREEVECRCIVCPEAFKRPFKELFDFTVFKDKGFLLILFSTFFFYNAIYVPFLYLRRLAVEHKMEENQAYLLTPIFGIGVLISRSTVGLVMLISEKISAIHITVSSLFISSIFSTLVCVYFDFTYQIFAQLIYGYSTGVFLPIRSVILIDFVGLDKLTSSMGFIFAVQGVGSFSGIFLAELLVNFFTDTRWALYYASFSFFISMIFIIPLFCLPTANIE